MMLPFSNTQPATGVVRDANGQILPKKIINPCLDSIDRKNLHRELMFNQKIGRNVLDQKSELEKVLRKQKEKQKMYTEQNVNKGISGELHFAVLQRANRQESERNEQNESDIQLNSEYLNARAKLRATH